MSIKEGKLGNGNGKVVNYGTIIIIIAELFCAWSGKDHEEEEDPEDSPCRLSYQRNMLYHQELSPIYQYLMTFGSSLLL